MQDGSNARQQIVEKLKNSTNILVTVSGNPSVDELSAALGLTLMLNKMDKHATAVFSGAIPPAIEFLDPEKTFENTTDSLRDFIIALDKEKADRLRYKVDGDMVRIFITPYRTNISEKDLEFSQGDFNVETIVALGVEEREELDKAIASHGRILHDATVVTINTKDGKGELGSVDWEDKNASSLCEMLMSLSEALQAGIIDEQIATALLTGIVAATDRFSNEHTKPRVMTMAAQLMAAGANQQLIATKLEGNHVIKSENEKKDVNHDGSMNLKENASAKLEREEQEKQKTGKDQQAKDGQPSAEKKKPNDGEMHIDHNQMADQPKPALMVDANDAITPEEIKQMKERDAVKTAEDALADALPQVQTQPNSTEQTLADLESVLRQQNQSAQQIQQPQQAPPLPALEQPQPTPPKKEFTTQPPSWMGKRIEPPTMGGSLSATSEGALQDKLMAEEEERNHTILSHGDHPVNENDDSYDPGALQFEASPPPTPMPSPPMPSPGLPTLDSSLAPPVPTPVEQNTMPNMADQLPPMAAPAPQNNVDAARDAVNAALGNPGSSELETPSIAPPAPLMPDLPPAALPAFEPVPAVSPFPPAGQPANYGYDANNGAPVPFSMPTPPPLPDMNTLPPLPQAPQQNPPAATGFGPTPVAPQQPDPFGPPPMQPGNNPNDPGQFKIPGQ